ncbi:aminoacyl-tRNA hydrolase [Rubrobacter calidifluminis]|uniref:aminoacyl-tRNA hydrolase n=1 Tax=Rubrobacter calidifluminis TaxID=1392640 RepID=UPI002362CAB3|nr:aminoacyl-tRNA hydrolase [Rubrobacter calidifluminis]
MAGLGNPGRRYANTRHNAGYMVVDELAARHGGAWRRRKRAEEAEIRLNGVSVVLVKPTTFMNDSGRALVAYSGDRLLVVHDDLDLPAGAVRVKVGGGAGGHNGLRSVIGNLGPEFVRVRVGIGRPPEGVEVIDYVLGRMDGTVREAVPRATDAVEVVVEEGAEAAMNRFNARSRASR